MKLIGSLTSPYVRKVRVVLAEKKLDYQLELEDVWSSDRITASNPLGKVPCLVMEGGEAVFDSRVIVEYVDTLSPVGRLIPERGRERAEGQRSAAWVERQMTKVQASLVAMNTGLADKPWCCNGNHLTLADVSVGCALAYLDFRFPQVGWRDSHANLLRLTDKLFTRLSFIETQPPPA
jgi:glutathione S-transferase